jgi:hypothetical protein
LGTRNSSGFMLKQQRDKAFWINRSLKLINKTLIDTELVGYLPGIVLIGKKSIRINQSP